MKEFFDHVRAKFGPLSQSQVEGFNAIVSLSHGLPLMHQAYMLATVWHECARTMQPITERGPKSYFSMYDAGTPKGRKLGNTIKGDGFAFRGRGYVQLTGRANYAKASKITGEDLLANPDLALRSDLAARIMIDGMTNGWFTGKRLGDYKSYSDMRRVINGTDRADMIAGYAKVFEDALLKAAGARLEPPKPAIPPTPLPVPPAAAKPVLTLQRVMAAIGTLIALLVAYLTVNGN